MICTASLDGIRCDLDAEHEGSHEAEYEIIDEASHYKVKTRWELVLRSTKEGT